MAALAHRGDPDGRGLRGVPGGVGEEVVEHLHDAPAVGVYLSMSVPFLAAALAYGLSKATVLATSVLAVSQDAASSAAHEGTTGNLSLANTGYDTHRFATLEGRQIRTSAHVDTDRYVGYAPAGATFTVTGDGTAVVDASTATSRIPAGGVRLSESLATSHETRAAEARSLSRHWSAEAGEARNAAVTDATGLIERYSHDVSVGEAFARGVTESASSQAQVLESHYEKLSEFAGITKDQAAVLTGQATVGGGWDFIVKAGAEGSVQWRGQTIEAQAWNRIKDYDRQHGVTETWSQVAEASRRYSTQTGDSALANLDPQLHTHAVLANMVRGGDDKWRSMANEGLYARQKLIGMLYRNELAAGLSRLGYDIEKTHADGRFEIAGVPRAVIDAFSTRRAEIEAAMEARDLGSPADNPRLAERAALMTREKKRDIDRDELRGVWQQQAADLGLDAGALVAGAVERAASPGLEAAAEPAAGQRTAPEPVSQALDDIAGERQPAAASMPGPPGERTRDGDEGRAPGREPGVDIAPPSPSAEAVAWAMAHLSEREAVFSRTDLFAAALAHAPGAVAIGDLEREVVALEKAGTLHPVDMPGAEDSLATDRTVGEEREAVALWRGGEGRGRAPMRSWQVHGHLNKGPLTAGQKDAVKLILSAKDRTVGVQGYAGTGKTTMLNRARTLAEKKGWRMAGLAPSASAVQTLASEAGIESETLQRFLARNAGVAEGRLTKKGAREMRAAFAKTILVVDEGSLASTVQARDLLRIANALRIPRVVLVGDAKQLDAVDAGKPFAQLQAAGMQTATMDEIMRQRDPVLKEAVEASLKGDIETAFEKLGSNVAEVKPDNMAGAVAARWLRLDEEARANTGVMAPSHELRQAINGHIRERLAREGRIHGPAMQSERLVSMGYTNAEKALAANYGAGDVVGFHRREGAETPAKPPSKAPDMASEPPARGRGRGGMDLGL